MFCLFWGVELEQTTKSGSVRAGNDDVNFFMAPSVTVHPSSLRVGITLPHLFSSGATLIETDCSASPGRNGNRPDWTSAATFLTFVKDFNATESP